MHETLTPRQLKKKSHPLSVFFPPLEQQRVKRAAAITGDTVSAFTRAAAITAAHRVEAEHTTIEPPLIRAA